MYQDFAPGTEFVQYSALRGAEKAVVVGNACGLVEWKYVGTAETFLSYATVLEAGMNPALANAGNMVEMRRS